jgi:hypothetical protein
MGEKKKNEQEKKKKREKGEKSILNKKFNFIKIKKTDDFQAIKNLIEITYEKY